MFSSVVGKQIRQAAEKAVGNIDKQ